MQNDLTCTIGVDLGGTKTAVALVDASGQVLERHRLLTRIVEGPGAIESEIIEAVLQILKTSIRVTGIGVGVAGQIDPATGTVRFAPNLNWRDVPIRETLSEALGLPVFVTNDVRAAAWGEWFHGAGRGCNDLICLFVGTGIGGGVVSGGHLLTGCSNTAGELGHLTVDINGPLCTCGNRGCLEAFAGGWAIAKAARDAVEKNPYAGAVLLRKAEGESENITAGMVAQAAHEGDEMSIRLMGTAAEALVAGAVSMINAFNPCRLILGGGVIEGVPDLVTAVEYGVRQRALPAARAPLQVLPSQLKGEAGVIGAAVMAMQELIYVDPH